MLHVKKWKLLSDSPSVRYACFLTSCCASSFDVVSLIVCLGYFPPPPPPCDRVFPTCDRVFPTCDGVFPLEMGYFPLEMSYFPNGNVVS